jgi:hypothetical protein
MLHRWPPQSRCHEGMRAAANCSLEQLQQQQWRLEHALKAVAAGTTMLHRWPPQSRCHEGQQAAANCSLEQ